MNCGVKQRRYDNRRPEYHCRSIAHGRTAGAVSDRFGRIALVFSEVMCCTSTAACDQRPAGVCRAFRSQFTLRRWPQRRQFGDDSRFASGSLNSIRIARAGRRDMDAAHELTVGVSPSLRSGGARNH
jgi:hypothetical protein